MFRIKIHGYAFGRLSREAIVKMAAARSEFKLTVATVQILTEATVVLKRRGKSLVPNELKEERVTSAFYQAAIDERIALHASARQGTCPK